MATSDADGNCDASPKGDPAGQLVHVIDDRTIALAERPGNRRADGYKNILTNPHVGLNFLIPGRGDTLRINGRARLVSDAPFFDDMVVKGHRPLLAVVVDIDDVFFHCAKAFLRSGLWKPETWDPEAKVPRRAVIASEVERDRHDASSSSTSTTTRPTTRRTSTRHDLPLPQGARHRERLRPAARPRRHGPRRAVRRAGAGAVRPAGRHRRRRRPAGDPDGGVRRSRAPRARAARTPSGSWTTATPTARSRRCAATGSGCSRATWSTRVWPTRSAPIPVGTRDGVKLLTVDGDQITADMGTPKVLGETDGRRSTGSTSAARHVDIGNPHAVAFVSSLDDAGPLLDRARPRPGRLPGRASTSSSSSAAATGTSRCGCTSAGRGRPGPAGPAPAR